MRETLCLVMTDDNDLVLINAIQFSYGLRCPYTGKSLLKRLLGMPIYSPKLIKHVLNHGALMTH